MTTINKPKETKMARMRENFQTGKADAAAGKVDNKKKYGTDAASKNYQRGHEEATGESMRDELGIKENKKMRLSLSRLIESELDKAELILAAKAIPDKLQDMAEKLATIEADDMMPLLDQLKSSFGPQASERFSQAVIGKVRELLDEVRSAKDAIDTEISNLEGVANGGPVATDMTDAMTGDDAAMGGDDMGMDAAMPPAPPAAGAAPDAGMPSDADIAGADGAPELGADDGAAGRARKESMTIRGRQIESAVKKLKESKNPDAVVLAEFRLNLTRHSVKEAAVRTAKTFRIDLSDVIDVVMEAKEKDKKNKKNPFGKKCPPFQRKDVPEKGAKKKVDESETEADHYKGLAGWVRDYQAQRKSGNVSGAKQTKANIDAKIKKHGLDAKKVYGADPKKKVVKKEDEADPCWKGYEMAGTKKKNGKTVPNCVKEDTLTASDRKHIADKNFAIHKDGKGKYPIEDKAHARDALSRVSANGTPAEKATVRRKVKAAFPSMEVNEILGFGKKTQKFQKTNPADLERECLAMFDLDKLDDRDAQNKVKIARNELAAKKSSFKEAEHIPADKRYRAVYDSSTMHFDIKDSDGKIVRKDASANRQRANEIAKSFSEGKPIREAVPQGGQTPAMMRAKQNQQPLNQSGKPQNPTNQVAADANDEEAPEMPGTTLTGPPGNPPKMPQPQQPGVPAQGAPKPMQANAAPVNKNAAAANQGQTGTQNTQTPTPGNPSGSPLGNQSNMEQDEEEVPANGQKQMVQAGEDGPKDTQPEDGKNVEPATEKPGFKATSPKGVTMMSTTLPVPPPKHSLMGSGMASPKPTSPTPESRMLQKFIKVVEDHDMSMEPMMAPFFPQSHEIDEFASPEPELEKPEAHDRIMGYVIRDNRGHMHGCKWIHNPHVPGMGRDEGTPKLYHDRQEAIDLADKWTREEGEHDGVMLDNITFSVGALYSNGQYKFPA